MVFNIILGVVAILAFLQMIIQLGNTPALVLALNQREVDKFIRRRWSFIGIVLLVIAYRIWG